MFIKDTEFVNTVHQYLMKKTNIAVQIPLLSSLKNNLEKMA
jgi:hypothetical protein